MTEVQKESVTQRVIKVVSEQVGVPEATINAETHFINDLGADSLDLVEVIMALEDEFMVEIPDREAEVCKTVQDFINVVEKYVR